jgi:hypothetical protein
MEAELQEMIAWQKEKLLAVAKRLVPHITSDDLLQPQDFPELDHHPDFRYEEGMLVGMQTVLAAIYSSKRSK